MILKGLKFIRNLILSPIDWIITFLILYANGVKFSVFKSYGWPKINIGKGATCTIGSGLIMNNREMSNPIGRFKKCSLVVSRNGKLTIGENVGMSSTAIFCRHEIQIGNHVKLGGNVVIYDTDFHSLNYRDRLDLKTDMLRAKVAPVKIGNHAFIGAHTTILKGVEIGDYAVIGACSVVTKDVPANEVWAGNPARKLK